MFFSGARGFGLWLACGRVRRVLLVVGLVFAALPAGSALASTTVGGVGVGNAWWPATATTNAGSAMAKAVSAGEENTCAVTNSGAAKCWGDNSVGQLGDGQSGFAKGRGVPVDVMGLGSGVREISTGQGLGLSNPPFGGDYTCALTDSGAVKCWGANGHGQLGDGTRTSSSVPVGVFGLGSGVKAISAGGLHTCALTGSGAVKCWGNNSRGQLGVGVVTPFVAKPVEVKGLGGQVIAISAGAQYTCALMASRVVKCWGDNASGQLGDGTRNDSSLPVDVKHLGSGVVAISAGGRHTCAITLPFPGRAKCWGNNREGQLGDGTTTESLVPVDVEGLQTGHGVAAISAGTNHTCAVTVQPSGAVKCWGANGWGQLGDGRSEGFSSVPVGVFGLGSGVAAISAGTLHTCAVTDSGAAKCWGINLEGELGNGAPENVSPVPVNVKGLS